MRWNRRLNIPLLVGLLLPAIALAVGVSCLHGVQVRRNAGALLARADRAERDGDLGSAAKCLRLLLGYQPDHPTALAKLGMILVTLARTDEDRMGAAQALEHALRLGPDRSDLRRRLVDLTMALGWYPIARAHLRILLDPERAAGDRREGRSIAQEAELEYLLAVCSENVHDDRDAVLHYRKSISLMPQRVDSYLRLASLLRERLADPDGADRVMDAREVKDGLIAANGRLFRAYLERGLYRRAHKIDGAYTDIAQALRMAPEEAEVLLAAAALEIERGDLEAARRHLTGGLAHHHRDGRILATLAWLERNTGHLDKAEECLRRGVEISIDREGRNQFVWLLADTLIDEGKWAEAKSVIEQLRRGPVRTELLTYLDGRISIGESRWLEAKKQLEKVYPSLEAERDLAYQVNLLLGRCFEQLGNIDEREAAFRRAVTLAPDRVEARVGLAMAQEVMGRLDEAIDGYRRVFARAPAVGIALGRLLILRNSRLPEAQRDWAAVDQVLDQTSKAVPHSTGVTILRAAVLSTRGQPGPARDLLRSARNAQPEQVELWTALAELAEQHEAAERAFAILQEAERRLGCRIELSLALVQHWANRGGPGAAGALAELELQSGRWPASDQERLLARLFVAYSRVGESGSARRILAELVRRRPWDPGLRFSQFEEALRDGDDAAMQRLMDQLKAIEDDPNTPERTEGTLWRCGRARYLLWSARHRGRETIAPNVVDEIRRLLAEAGNQRPSWPLVPLILAEADELAHHPEGALRNYLTAIALGMAEPIFIRRAVELLFEFGRFEQADGLIRTWQARGLGSADPRFQRLAAEVSLRVNDQARALALATQSIPPGSTDYRDHLWLGQFYWAAREEAKAEPELRRSVELAGGAPEAWVTLVQFLARTGSREKARTATEEARRQLARDRAAAALARCYAELGEIDQARAQFRAAVAEKPEDIATLRGAATFAVDCGMAREAETYLLKVINLKEKSPDDAAWARRLLATVLAAAGAHRRALELVGMTDEGASYMPGPDEPAEELRARAAVLAARNHRVARRTAIRILEFLTERESVTSEDRFRLAQLYEAEGDRTNSENQIRSLLAGDSTNQTYLAYAARTLLRHRQIDRAAPLVDTLERQHPRALVTAELKARLAKERGRPDDAVGILRLFVRERPDQVGKVAAVLEDLGQMTAAEGFYRQFAVGSGREQSILTLAGFLGRRGRSAAAIDICEKALSSCPAELVAETAVAALYSAPVDAGQCRRAAELIQRQLKQTPRSAGLLFHLGNIRSLEGRYQEAEQFYRQSLASDPSNSGPLANLAWLLARRDGRGTDALELVERAMKLDGPAPDLLDTRAVGYLAAGRSDLAIQDLVDAISLKATPLKYAHLAQAYLMIARRDDADAALRTARKMGLSLEMLSPLERENCERLFRELNVE